MALISVSTGKFKEGSEVTVWMRQGDEQLVTPPPGTWCFHPSHKLDGLQAYELVPPNPEKNTPGVYTCANHAPPIAQ